MDKIKLITEGEMFFHSFLEVGSVEFDENKRYPVVMTFNTESFIGYVKNLERRENEIWGEFHLTDKEINMSEWLISFATLKVVREGNQFKSGRLSYFSLVPTL